MRNLFLFTSLLTMLYGCSSYGVYKQPAVADSATLHIIPARQVANELDPWVFIRIDGQDTSYTATQKTGFRGTAPLFVNPLKLMPGYQQINPIKIVPGEHHLFISITSYPRDRAKYAFIEKTIDFLPNAYYALRVDIPSAPPEQIEDDSQATVFITKQHNNQIILQQELTLKDSWGRSPSGVDWRDVSGGIISGIPLGL